MNSLGLGDYIGRSKRVTLEELKKELNSVRKNINSIEAMDVSDEAKKLIVQELEAKIKEIKEQMHDCIDLL